MSNRFIMAAAGVNTGGSIQGFVTRLESVTLGSYSAPAIAIDSATKETYIGFRNFIAKFNADGTLSWQRTISNTNLPSITSIAVLATTILVVATGESSAVATRLILNASDGTQVSVSNYSGVDIFTGKRALTLSDGSYLVGYDDGGFSFAEIAIISKYSSANVHQWKSVVSDSFEEFSCFLQDIAVDTSESVYMLANFITTPVITKLSSSGAATWQIVYYVSASPAPTYSLAASSDSLYVLGTNTAVDTFILTKLNSSTGAVVWERSIAPTGTLIAGSVRVGPDGAIYCITNLNSAGIGAQDLVIYKFDSSGNNVWQRAFGTSTSDGGQSPKEIIFDDLGYYYICGASSTDSRVYIARLPTDGTLTGTYGPFTYSSQSHTVSTTTLVSTSSTSTGFTNNAVSPSTVTPSTTSSAASFTATRILI